MIDVSVGVAPPRWERMGSPRRTVDGKTENEDDHLGAAIESSSKNVVVLAEPARVVCANVHLRDDAGDDATQNDRVDTRCHPARVLWVMIS